MASGINWLIIPLFSKVIVVVPFVIIFPDSLKIKLPPTAWTVPVSKTEVWIVPVTSILLNTALSGFIDQLLPEMVLFVPSAIILPKFNNELFPSSEIVIPALSIKTPLFFCGFRI